MIYKNSLVSYRTHSNMMFLFPTMCQFFQCVSCQSVRLWGDRVTPITLSSSSLFPFIYIFHSFPVWFTDQNHATTQQVFALVFARSRPFAIRPALVRYYHTKPLIKPWTTHLINDYSCPTSNYLFIIPRKAIRSSISPLMKIFKGWRWWLPIFVRYQLSIYVDIFIRIILIID